MKTFLIILAVIAALIIITAIKASLYKQEKPQVTPMPEERVDEERVQRHLSQAIAIKTISNPDNSKVDWGEFEKFHDFLEKEYPLTHKTLKREKNFAGGTALYLAGHKSRFGRHCAFVAPRCCADFGRNRK